MIQIQLCDHQGCRFEHHNFVLVVALSGDHLAGYYILYPLPIDGFYPGFLVPGVFSQCVLSVFSSSFQMISQVLNVFPGMF
jgi:hypothetical protein